MRAAAAIAATLLAAAAAGAPAAAATPAYRSWTYWHRNGASWVFADTGPASYRPADGSIEGWRYELATESDARPPATPPSFATICASTPSRSGDIRIAVVLDYGTSADARAGQHPPAARAACAQAPTGADAATLLATIATIRYRADGLICAFDDYPTTGCVDVVTPAAPTPTPRATPRPTPKPKPTPKATRTPAPAPRTSTRQSPSTTPSPTASATPTPTPTHRHRSTPTVMTTHPTATSPAPTPPALSTPSQPAATSTSAVPVAVAAGPPATDAGLVLTGSRRPGDRHTLVGSVVGIALLAVLAAAAGLVARRRRARP